MVICLERGADSNMAQLMPLPLTVSCFSKIQIGFTFLVLADLGSPAQRAVKRMCVCSSTTSSPDININTTQTVQNRAKYLLVPANIMHLDMWYSIESSGSEVFLMEVDIHVEASRAKVISSWYIGHNTLAVVSDWLTPHPHIPVPLLHKQTCPCNSFTTACTAMSTYHMYTC